jgi:superfamily II DNA or RNA helicase
VRGLAADPNRHLILVTATPHSGKEEAFRSLLAFLDSEFDNLPADLTGKENEPFRRHLARHLVQRRRGDIRHFMAEETPFPDREEAEETYRLHPDYRRLFDRVLSYARETVKDPEGGTQRQRVRWWSALALLRALASSPAAAAATLRKRAQAAGAESLDEVDEIGRETVLDVDPVDSTEDLDVVAGADPGEEAVAPAARRRLLEMAREADSLRDEKDEKIRKAAQLVDQLLADGFHPIVFCRFIDTANYVAEQLRARLKEKAEVVAVTGTLPPEEREARVLQLAEAPQRVLVCTDCLSEGINLQDHFDAVVHYDLSWNPTRHEQRQGRVDRFGQKRSPVRVLTYYGIDNQIDGIVVDVLIRKHETIRSSLGYSVPVPADTNTVMEAVFEGLLLRESAGTAQEYLPGFEEYFRPRKEAFFTEWDNAAEREKRSRTMFAQETIKADEVARELDETRAAVGSAVDVRRFMTEAVQAYGGVVVPKNEAVKFDLRETSRAMRDAVGGMDEFEAVFEPPALE